jgi:hypothetical protein
MKRVRLTEAELTKIVKRVIKEQNQIDAGEIDTSNFDDCLVNKDIIGRYIVGEILNEIDSSDEWHHEYGPGIPDYLKKYAPELNELINSEDILSDVYEGIYSGIFSAIDDNANFRKLWSKITNEVNRSED